MANVKSKAISVSDHTRDVVGKVRLVEQKCLYCGKVLFETTLLPKNACIEIKCVTCKNTFFAGSAYERSSELEDNRCHVCDKLLFRAAKNDGAVIKKDCTRAGCRIANNKLFV